MNSNPACSAQNLTKTPATCTLNVSRNPLLVHTCVTQDRQIDKNSCNIIANVLFHKTSFNGSYFPSNFPTKTLHAFLVSLNASHIPRPPHCPTFYHLQKYSVTSTHHEYAHCAFFPSLKLPPPLYSSPPYAQIPSVWGSQILGTKSHRRIILYVVATNICGSSARNMLRVTLIAPRTFRQLLNLFENLSTPTVSLYSSPNSQNQVSYSHRTYTPYIQRQI